MAGEKPFALELEIRRVNSLYRQNLTAPLIIFVVTCIFLTLAWGQLPSYFLITWAVVLNIGCLIRAVASARWIRQNKKITSMRQLKRWLAVIQIGCLVSGCGLGILAWAANYLGPTEQIILQMVFFSTVAGTVVVYAQHSLSCALLVLLTAAPLSTIGILLSGKPTSGLLAVGMLAYTAIFFRNARTAYQESNSVMKINLELQQHREKLHMAMEYSGAISWELDLRTLTLDFKGSVGKLLENFAVSTATVQDYLSMVPDDDRARVAEEFLGAAITGSIEIEHKVKWAESEVRYIALRGQAKKDKNGRVTFLTGILWDITNKKRDEMLRYEHDLIESANKAKLVFLANVSHEMRTPLTAINGFAESLLEAGELTANGRELAGVILRNGKYLASVVHDLLDLSKAESDHIYIQTTKFSLIDEITDALHVVHSAVRHKGLKLEVIYDTPVPRMISSDSTRLRQILVNLISNAIKYTERGTVTMRLSFEALTGGMGRMHIVVADTGIGIASDVSNRLFQPFARSADANVQRESGSGLGLALSRSLAQRLGGDLQLVASKRGGGSTFELTFNSGPVAGVEFVAADEARIALNEAAITQRRQDFSGKRILVVEDDEDIRWLLTDYLQRTGAQVDTSENGAEAVEKGTTSRFDAIIMDIKMPVMDGYMATSVLRQNGVQEPIIALTAHASSADQLLCYQAGCDSYLSKPIDFAHLYEVLSARLGVQPGQELVPAAR